MMEHSGLREGPVTQGQWIAVTDDSNKGKGDLLMNNHLNEEITKVAYELYEKSGRQEGNDLVNWLAAEKIVHFQQMISHGIRGEAISLLEYQPVFNAKDTRPTPDKSKSRSIKAQKEGIRRKSGQICKQLHGC